MGGRGKGGVGWDGRIGGEGEVVPPGWGEG